MSRRRKPANHVPCAAWSAAQPHEAACKNCRFGEECDRQGYLPSGVVDEEPTHALADQGFKISAHPEDQSVTWQVLEVK